MFNERSTDGSDQAEPTIASGGRQTGRSMRDTGTIIFPVVKPKLSDSFLARHLADVASLAVAEGDFRLAEHLVDVAYHLASDK